MIGLHELFGLQPRQRGWVEFVLGTPVVLWVGWPILRKFWFSLLHRELNMYTLVGLGVGLAYLFSLAAVLFPGLLPAKFREHDGAIGTCFEAAAVIVTLVLLGDFLQLRAMGQTSQAIQQLLKLAPNLAWRVRDGGGEERVGADTLLARIVHMVGEAQRTRAPIQRLADIIAAWFVQIVVAIAVVTALTWWFFGPEPRLAYAFVNAVAVLIIACPCAVGLAAPISMTVAMGRARGARRSMASGRQNRGVFRH